MGRAIQSEGGTSVIVGQGGKLCLAEFLVSGIVI